MAGRVFALQGREREPGRPLSTRAPVADLPGNNCLR